MKILMVILLMSAISLSSCKNKKNITDDVTTTKSSDMKDDHAKPIINNDFVYPKENSAFDIEKVIIDDHLLSIDVQYSGGCESHEFELHTHKMYKKSLPPQLDVYLKHNNNGDACRALKMETLTFDVSELKYPGNADELIVIIHGANGDAQRVSYKLK